MAAPQPAEWHGAAAGLGTLPDDLLVAILGRLSIEERQRGPALVSRRFSQLCHMPALLHSLRLTVEDTDQQHEEGQFLPRLRSLAVFLSRQAAGRARQLHLVVSVPAAAIADDAEAETRTLLAAALSSCSGSLEELQLEVQHGSVIPASWLGVFHGLRRLSLSARGLLIESSFQGMSALQDLELCSPDDELILTAQAQLPQGLTRLALRYLNYDFFDYEEDMPAQFGALPRLRHLALEGARYVAESYALLARLTGLERLAILDCAALPACLPQLTWLRSLAVRDGGEFDEDRWELLCSSLPHLSQLTSLQVNIWYLLADGSPPSQLAELTQLCHLHWAVSCQRGGSLPPGEWLASLRRLEAPCDLLEASLPVLAQAQQLEQLGVFSPEHRDLPSVLRWAVGLPPQQRLVLRAASMTAVNQQAAQEAQRSCPGLLVEAHYVPDAFLLAADD